MKIRRQNNSFGLRRLRARIDLAFSNFFKKETLTPFFGVILISLVLIFFLLPISVSYKSSKTEIKEGESIPKELKVAIVYFDYKDLSPDNNKTSDIYQKLNKFLTSNILTKIIFFAPSADSNILQNTQTIQKSLPKDNVQVNIVAKDFEQICKAAKDDYSIDKAIVISYSEVSGDISYICNNYGLYTRNYILKDLEFNYSKNFFQTAWLELKSLVGSN